MQPNRTSTLRQSLKLAWPISLQSILVTMLGMSDIVMVGHLGDAAVASVGLGNRIQFVVLIILSGLAAGVGVLSAQYNGAGKTGLISPVIIKSLVIGAGVLLPVVLLTFAFGDHIVGLGTTDPVIINTGETYLWVTMPSLAFIIVVMVFENALRGFSQVKLPMVLGSIAIFINIALNYWLINGGLGIDALGVLGAAWATFIARGLHALMIIYCLAKSKHEVFPTRLNSQQFYQKQQWIHLIKLVWPMMVSFGVWSIGTFVYQLIFGRIGTQELAVMSLMAPLEGLLISFFFGFASACSILVGQRLGQDAFASAWSVARGFAISAPIVTFLLALGMLSLESVVFMPYTNLQPETLSVAHNIFMLITFGTCIKVFNMTASMGILRAGGDNKHCMLIDISGMWIIGIPLTVAAAFYFNLSLYWVVLVTYSEEITKSIMFVYRMRAKHWLRNLTVQTPSTTSTGLT
ncbi:MATE family efflux transporter [Aliiglaciecola sp. LCG003]|uniref:MATE family efflux transporter n=1 Tax=Aliiglaciecola sp. LCG003 TaxID=3053655 RepID=UPI002573F10A|nr:MATE family efflux transporter [Aliiglaciecola sp. LCG003]WJG10675.1 MATE family efflux transporter [Aliiglaciecola sp. LCG003]